MLSLFNVSEELAASFFRVEDLGLSPDVVHTTSLCFYPEDRDSRLL
jgi:hypothetical protein